MMPGLTATTSPSIAAVAAAERWIAAVDPAAWQLRARDATWRELPITPLQALSFMAFTLLGLQYAMLLPVLVGLSVIVPYVGATVVTFPVLLVAWFQWGWTAEFAWLSVAYFVIQALDGNVLVPLLFSEVVNLHPVAIIVAILVFGGLWGFWGVFFAIPLATLVQAVLSAWPRDDHPAAAA